MSKFNETVDLSQKIKDPRANALKIKEQEKLREDAIKKKVVKKLNPKRVAKQNKQVDEIDELFSEKSTDKKAKDNLRNINKPKLSSAEDSVYKKLAFLLLFILIVAMSYFVFFRGDHGSVTGVDSGIENKVRTGWYRVKLIDGKVYYGQIADTSAEPIMIRNVYYDYDQLRKTAETDGIKKETGSLRLVKRGKETDGPSGDMEVFRSKVLLMEELSKDSKVLGAILEYEK